MGNKPWKIKGDSSRVTVIPSLPLPSYQRVAAYCRVSTSSESQLHSFENQTAYFTEYISQNPAWILTKIYADKGISGKDMSHRPALLKLLRDCESQKLDRVLVKSISRFARNTEDGIRTARRLKSLGIILVFLQDSITTESESWETTFLLKSSIAQFELEGMSRKMKQSVRMQKENGTFKTSSVPYGYQLVDGERMIIPQEKEIIDYVNHLYLSGYGTPRIVRLLKGKGNRHWTTNKVLKLLTNPTYLGRISGMEGRQHPAITDKTTFDKVTKLRKQRLERKEG